jgi:hypothetical protein
MMPTSADGPPPERDWETELKALKGERRIQEREAQRRAYVTGWQRKKRARLERQRVRRATRETRRWKAMAETVDERRERRDLFRWQVEAREDVDLERAGLVPSTTVVRRSERAREHLRHYLGRLDRAPRMDAAEAADLSWLERSD